MKKKYFSARYKMFNFIKNHIEALNKLWLIVLILLSIGYLYTIQPIISDNSLLSPISEIFSISLGFFLASALRAFKNRFKKVYEDELKVNHSYKKLDKQYEKRYDCILEVENKYGENEEKKFKYHCLFANIKKEKLELDDIIIEDSLECFEPLEFVNINLSKLLSCHKSSYIENYMLLRLKNFCYDEKKRKLILNTMRTRNIYSLCMNRACDFDLDGITLRRLYESFPEITSLEHSVFSNHIGIQVAIIINGYIVLVERKKDSTVSKNGLCAAFASKFNCIEKYNQGNEGNKVQTITKKIDREALIKWVIDKLNSKFEFDVKFTKDKLIFLGLGQELYECGRPQMFFMYEFSLDKKIKDISKKFKIKTKKDEDKKYNRESDIYFIKYKDKNNNLVKPKNIDFEQETRCAILKNGYEGSNGKKFNEKTFKLIEDACLASLVHVDYYENGEKGNFFPELDSKKL